MNTSATPSLARLLPCTLGGIACALPMEQVQGIERSDRVQRQEEGDEWVGLLPQGAESIPVFQPAIRMGVCLPRRMQYAIVLRAAPPWALLVDQVGALFSVPTSQIDPLPDSAIGGPRDCFCGVVRRDKELLLLLAPDKFLDAPSPQPGSLARHRTPSPGPAGRNRASTPSRRPNRLVVFTTADSVPQQRPIALGLCIRDVLEITEAPPLRSLPGMPSHYRGIANWRERSIAVLDLGQRLALASSRGDARKRLLVAHTGSQENIAGFLVQPAIRICRLPIPHVASSRRLPVPSRLVKTVVELQQVTLVVPDLHACCAADPTGLPC